MKKIGVITINGNYNYGNRLQNYALLSVLGRYSNQVHSLWVDTIENYKKDAVKLEVCETQKEKRFNKFCDFTSKYIKIEHYENTSDINVDEYDYFVVGSDQVWNSTFLSFDKDTMLLEFSKDKNKNIAYAASIGINEIPEKDIEIFKNGFNNFKYLSVRENKAQEIVEDLTGRTDATVVLDPTMLIDTNEWNSLILKPENINPDEKYILTCFLGTATDEQKEDINRIASEKGLKVINLNDKEGEFYVYSPSEFLYFHKNAELICTDSFHSCAFSIIYNKPFIAYDRNSASMSPMNSRIVTLLNTFELQDRRYENKIYDNHFVCDYTNANEILKREQNRAISFIENALGINM